MPRPALASPGKPAAAAGPGRQPRATGWRARTGPGQRERCDSLRREEERPRRAGRRNDEEQRQPASQGQSERSCDRAQHAPARPAEPDAARATLPRPARCDGRGPGRRAEATPTRPSTARAPSIPTRRRRRPSSTTPERREKRRSRLAGTSRPCRTWISRNSSASGTWASAKVPPRPAGRWWSRTSRGPTNAPIATTTLSQKPSWYRVRHEYTVAGRKSANHHHRKAGCPPLGDRPPAPRSSTATRTHSPDPDVLLGRWPGVDPLDPLEQRAVIRPSPGSPRAAGAAADPPDPLRDAARHPAVTRITSSCRRGAGASATARARRRPACTGAADRPGAGTVRSAVGGRRRGRRARPARAIRPRSTPPLRCGPARRGGRRRSRARVRSGPPSP